MKLRPASSPSRSPATLRRAIFSRLKSKIENRKSKIQAGFTLLEILLSLALVGLMLVSLNTFVFSMGELWGRGADVHLFEQPTRAVTRFLDRELRTAVLPPSSKANATPIALQEIRPLTGMTEKLLTFELPAGCRLFVWPERPLPEVVCSLQVRERDGLFLLWHSRLEKNFETDSPRETLVTPLVTGLAYEYYDVDFNRWTTETSLKMDNSGNPMTPQRLRLKFAYNKLTRETVITLPATTGTLPLF
jgi:prepilin-type N-terminal cleavage/methylation domain-containing protein